MCSRSQLGAVQPIVGGGGGGAPSAPIVAAARAKAFPEEYIVIDCREAGEPTNEGAAKPDCVNVPLGALLTQAYDHTLEKQPWFAAGKTLLMLCNEGMRARVAATEVAAQGYKAAYVPRGMLEWGSPAATKADYLCVLMTKKPELVALALAAVKTKQTMGEQAVLVGMSDGVEIFRKAGVQGCAETDTVLGMPTPEPFPAFADVYNAFKKNGGVVLLCTTCCKHRGLSQADMLDGVKLFGLPDLVRMQTECTATLQFS